MSRYLSRLAAFALLVLAAFVTLPGSPRWVFNGSANAHYIATLHTTSFPAGSLADVEVRRALLDWQGIGATSFRTAYNRAQPNYTNNFDGVNAWVWVADPDPSWDARTILRHNGSQILECDVHFNLNYHRGWTYQSNNPCLIQSATGPADVRSVARRMIGEALGLTENNGVLCNMNGTPTPGSGVQHAPSTATSTLPHADDRAGCRFLYPGSGISRNVMASSWREPAPGTSVARKIWLTGTWTAGNIHNVSCYLENQSNTTVFGGTNGIRTGVYLSTDSAITTTDTQIGNFSWNNWPAHSSGYYAPSALPVYLPLTVPAGTYYVGVIHDSTNVVAETAEHDNACVVGQIQVVNTVLTLHVQSDNPTAGVSITSNIPDLNSQNTVTTPGTFQYWNGTSLTLTAPATHGGRVFDRWVFNGTPQPAGIQQLQMTLFGTYLAVAEYGGFPATTTTYGSGCSTGAGPVCASANAMATTLSSIVGNPASYALIGSVAVPTVVDGIEFLTRASAPTTLTVDLHHANANGPFGPRLARGQMIVGTATNWYTASFPSPVTASGSFALVFQNPHPMLDLPVAASGTAEPHFLRIGPAGAPWVGPLMTQPWVWRVTCPTVAATTPALSYTGLPQIGTSYQIDLSAAPAGTVALLAIGGSSATTSLLSWGAPGCTLLVNPVATVFRTVSANGTASYMESIPNAPGFVGARFFHQWLVGSPFTNPLGVVVSNAGEIRIGTP